MYTVTPITTSVGHLFRLSSDEYPDYFTWMAELNPKLVAIALKAVAGLVQERERRESCEG